MEKKSKITAMLSVLLVSAPTTAKKLQRQIFVIMR